VSAAEMPMDMLNADPENINYHKNMHLEGMNGLSVPSGTAIDRTMVA
jgi:hypothetical protein